jgi:hypothetical protein
MSKVVAMCHCMVARAAIVPILFAAPIEIFAGTIDPNQPPVFAGPATALAALTFTNSTGAPAHDFHMEIFDPNNRNLTLNTGALPPTASVQGQGTPHVTLDYKFTDDVLPQKRFAPTVVFRQPQNQVRITNLFWSKTVLAFPLRRILLWTPKHPGSWLHRMPSTRFLMTWMCQWEL